MKLAVILLSSQSNGYETVGEWMGPGGPHGLQLRWRASFGVRGGFDSLALPPIVGRIPLQRFDRVKFEYLARPDPLMSQ